MPRLEERVDRHAADVAGAAGDQDLHGRGLPEQAVDEAAGRSTAWPPVMAGPGLGREVRVVDRRRQRLAARREGPRQGGPRAVARRRSRHRWRGLAAPGGTPRGRPPARARRARARRPRSSSAGRAAATWRYSRSAWSTSPTESARSAWSSSSITPRPRRPACPQACPVRAAAASRRSLSAGSSMTRSSSASSIRPSCGPGSQPELGHEVVAIDGERVPVERRRGAASSASTRARKRVERRVVGRQAAADVVRPRGARTARRRARGPTRWMNRRTRRRSCRARR